MADTGPQKAYKIAVVGLSALSLVAIAALVFSGADKEHETVADRLAREQAEAAAQIAPAFNLKRIELPDNLRQLERGAYEITVQGENGPRDCIANVILTTHGARNVVLTCP
ncbi:MAG: hypothetical protein KKA05_08615 [Alphaproteobacteria bacterium]|nr:hypothetical protein [Alphaproteobacteria bacterium]